VGILVSPADTNGLGNGTTAFTRVYSNTINVTLIAPATASSNAFLKWQLDGVDAGTNLSLVVSMSTATLRRPSTAVRIWSAGGGGNEGSGTSPATAAGLVTAVS
jgi:hypothetical protein